MQYCIAPPTLANHAVGIVWTALLLANWVRWPETWWDSDEDGFSTWRVRYRNPASATHSTATIIINIVCKDMCGLKKNTTAIAPLCHNFSGAIASLLLEKKFSISMLLFKLQYYANLKTSNIEYFLARYFANLHYIYPSISSQEC